MSFKPAASMLTLQKRALLLRNIREYFYREDVLEIEVPALSRYSVSDVNLSGLKTQIFSEPFYLQTSPEFYMKRALAAQIGSIYSLAKAYRADESGQKHRPEFTMLEWYRVGFNDLQLIRDLECLLAFVGVNEVVQRLSYREVFIQFAGLNPHLATTEELKRLAQTRYGVDWQDELRTTWLDLIFSYGIEPNLHNPTAIYDFPAEQCALAKIAVNTHGEPVAKRFELYWRGIELANGYWELTCPVEQQARFEADNHIRAERGQPIITPDKHLMAALKSGVPECAGIALGVDRLLMCLLDVKSISEVNAFDL